MTNPVYTYDAAGRVLTCTHASDPKHPDSYTCTYDAAGNQHRTHGDAQKQVPTAQAPEPLEWFAVVTNDTLYFWPCTHEAKAQVRFLIERGLVRETPIIRRVTGTLGEVVE